MNLQHPLYFQEEVIEVLIYITYWDRANHHGTYADGYFHSTIDNNDGHIPFLLIMFTCTVLHYAHQESQNNKGGPLNPSKSKLKADRPHCSYYFNYNDDSGKDISYCAATGHKFLTSACVGDMYTFMMNTWNTLPERYQQRVYKDNLATVMRQIQQAENPTPAMVIRMQEAHVHNSSGLNYLTSEVVP